jgi:hypothetical protein
MLLALTISGVKTSPLDFTVVYRIDKFAKQRVTVNRYKGPGTVLGRLGTNVPSDPACPRLTSNPLSRA